jgi:hypothetical protein
MIVGESVFLEKLAPEECRLIHPIKNIDSLQFAFIRGQIKSAAHVFDVRGAFYY